MGRLSLRFVAFGYLALILIGPIAMMVWRTAEDFYGAWAAITNPDTIAAFKLTFLVMSIAVVVNTVFGIVCALVIVRGNIRGRGFLNAFVDLPLSLSPVVVGFSLVVLYGVNGWFSVVPEQRLRDPLRDPLDRDRHGLRHASFRRARGRADPARDRHRAGTGGADARRFGLADVPANHAPVYRVGRRLRRRAHRCSLHRRVRAVAIVSGNIVGETQTATLKVEDSYQFAYGNYAPRTASSSCSRRRRSRSGS